jgi:hypothetical protein
MQRRATAKIRIPIIQIIQMMMTITTRIHQITALLKTVIQVSAMNVVEDVTVDAIATVDVIATVTVEAEKSVSQ